MMSSHKISFSIADILDPNKFNSKRANELPIAKEKLTVPDAEGTSLEWANAAARDFRDERTDAGKENAAYFSNNLISVSSKYAEVSTKNW